MTSKAVEVLVQDIGRCNETCGIKFENVMLKLVEQCLSQIGGFDQMFSPMLNSKLCHILTQIAKNIKHQQFNVLSQLRDKLNALFTQLKKTPMQSVQSVFREKMSVIEFNEVIGNFTRSIKQNKSSALVKNMANNSGEISHNQHIRDETNKIIETILCLVSSINIVVTVEMRSLFTWQSNDSGDEVIVTVKNVEFRTVLFDIFTFCRSLQPLLIERDMSCDELQTIIDILEPYYEKHSTLEEKSKTDLILGQIGSNGITDETGKCKLFLNVHFLVLLTYYHQSIHFHSIFLTHCVFQSLVILRMLIHHGTVLSSLLPVLCCNLE